MIYSVAGASQYSICAKGELSFLYQICCVRNCLQLARFKNVLSSLDCMCFVCHVVPKFEVPSQQVIFLCASIISARNAAFLSKGKRPNIYCTLSLCNYGEQVIVIQFSVSDAFIEGLFDAAYDSLEDSYLPRCVRTIESPGYFLVCVNCIQGKAEVCFSFLRLQLRR